MRSALICLSLFLLPEITHAASFSQITNCSELNAVGDMRFGGPYQGGQYQYAGMIRLNNNRLCKAIGGVNTWIPYSPVELFLDQSRVLPVDQSNLEKSLCYDFSNEGTTNGQPMQSYLNRFYNSGISGFSPDVLKARLFILIVNSNQSGQLIRETLCKVSDYRTQF